MVEEVVEGNGDGLDEIIFGSQTEIAEFVVDFTLPWAAQVGVTTTNGIETLFGNV